MGTYKAVSALWSVVGAADWPSCTMEEGACAHTLYFRTNGEASSQTWSKTLGKRRGLRSSTGNRPSRDFDIYRRRVWDVFTRPYVDSRTDWPPVRNVCAFWLEIYGDLWPVHMSWSRRAGRRAVARTRAAWISRHRYYSIKRKNDGRFKRSFLFYSKTIIFYSKSFGQRHTNI